MRAGSFSAGNANEGESSAKSTASQRVTWGLLYFLFLADKLLPREEQRVSVLRIDRVKHLRVTEDGLAEDKVALRRISHVHGDTSHTEREILFSDDKGLFHLLKHRFGLGSLLFGFFRRRSREHREHVNRDGLKCPDDLAIFSPGKRREKHDADEKEKFHRFRAYRMSNQEEDARTHPSIIRSGRMLARRKPPADRNLPFRANGKGHGST